MQILREVSATSENKANTSAYKAFGALSDEEQRLLLSRIRVVDNSPNIVDIRAKMVRQMWVYSKYPEALYSRVEGWWFQRAVGNLINNSQINTIVGTELITQIRELGSQLQDDNLPSDFPVAIYMDESELPENERVFVEQLRLLLISESRLRLAIGHYYRAFQQRSRWVEEGLIYPSELASYEHYLEGEWRTQFEIMREDLGSLPSEDDMVRLGRNLFRWADTAQSKPIRPKFMDPGYSRGNYHLLANDLRIGWHSEFQDRLSHLMIQAARAVS